MDSLHRCRLIEHLFRFALDRFVCSSNFSSFPSPFLLLIDCPVRFNDLTLGHYYRFDLRFIFVEIKLQEFWQKIDSIERTDSSSAHKPRLSTFIIIFILQYSQIYTLCCSLCSLFIYLQCLTFYIIKKKTTTFIVYFDFLNKTCA